MAKELLFEIGTEEIPSAYLPGALQDLKANSARILLEGRIRYEEVRTLGTPRRLTLYVRGIPETQEPLSREVVGPPQSVAFDADGNPTPAARGFAKAQGIAIEQLEVRPLARGEYLVAVLHEAGARTDALLPTLLPRIITSLTFPKAMRWGQGSLRFVRPIRWILALYGGRTVPFEIDRVRSGNRTYGHRFLAPRAIRVRTVGEYLEKLEAACVLVDQDRRREMVRRLPMEAAAAVKGKALLDDALVETVTHLVEWPNVVCGSFKPEYLQLPPEVITTPMRKHQRYFPVVDAEGKLLPHFIAISNMQAKDMAVIREGNERVLRARLHDAEFFYREDREVPLADRVARLRQVLFQEKLGSVAEKVERIEGLVDRLAAGLDPALVPDARRAARLCKADLVTSMVKEFPDLQGAMGRIYALLSGEKPEVAQAIEEHYLPRFAGDRLPASRLGALVGFADRMDSIVGCFGVGLIPSGSEDPFALRRAASGAIQILLAHRLSLGLGDVCTGALVGLQGRLTRPDEDVRRDVLEFLRARLEGILTERGLPADLVQAALAAGCDDVPDAALRAEALVGLQRDPDFGEILVAFRRVVNILPAGFQRPVDPARFVEGAERALHAEVVGLKGDVDRLVARRDYLGALRRIAALKPLVDMFFEEVLVMAEDVALRENRLALVAEVADLFRQIADFTRIVGGGPAGRAGG